MGSKRRGKEQKTRRWGQKKTGKIKKMPRSKVPEITEPQLIANQILAMERVKGHQAIENLEAKHGAKAIPVLMMIADAKEITVPRNADPGAQMRMAFKLLGNLKVSQALPLMRKGINQIDKSPARAIYAVEGLHAFRASGGAVTKPFRKPLEKFIRQTERIIKQKRKKFGHGFAEEEAAVKQAKEILKQIKA